MVDEEIKPADLPGGESDTEVGAVQTEEFCGASISADKALISSAHDFGRGLSIEFIALLRQESNVVVIVLIMLCSLSSAFRKSSSDFVEDISVTEELLIASVDSSAF